MQFKNWYWALAAMAVLLVLNTPNACAAGACDTEDFYPTYYYHYKYSYKPNSEVIDLIMSDYYWTKKSQYFADGYYLSFDYLRTVSCTDATDKDVYDYITGSLRTNLPKPHRENIEEWNPIICWIDVGTCDEEAELGTRNPKDIQLNTWYYLDAEFKVKAVGEKYAMRVEPEVEPATNYTPPPWEEWCQLACYYTTAGSSGW